MDNLDHFTCMEEKYQTCELIVYVVVKTNLPTHPRRNKSAATQPQEPQFFQEKEISNRRGCLCKSTYWYRSQHA